MIFVVKTLRMICQLIEKALALMMRKSDDGLVGCGNGSTVSSNNVSAPS